MTLDAGVYDRRLELATAQMPKAGMDYMLVGPSADLRYLLGVGLKANEKLTLLVLGKDGRAALVASAHMEPLLSMSVEYRGYDFSDDPAKIVAEYISSGQGELSTSPLTVGVADEVLATFLISIQHLLPNARFTHAAPVLSALRLIKDAEEVRLLRRLGALLDDVFEEMIGRQFSGRTDTQVAADIGTLLRKRGINAPHFPPSVASGQNSGDISTLQSSSTMDVDLVTGRLIQPGDVLTLDFGGSLDGYSSAISRTVFVSSAPGAGSEEEHIYNLVKDAQQAAYEAAQPGVSSGTLDEIARGLLSEGGYGEYFMHPLGYGFGLSTHIEAPYLISGNPQPLEPGMVFSIEPGIYIPGRFGVHIRDVVLLQGDGAERLSNATRAITVVP